MIVSELPDGELYCQHIRSHSFIHIVRSSDTGCSGVISVSSLRLDKALIGKRVKIKIEIVEEDDKNKI